MSNPFDGLTSVFGNTSITQELQQLEAANQQIWNDQNANTQYRLSQMTAARGSGSSRSSGSWLSEIGGVLGGGLGLTSLVTGLAGLFGGGGPATPEPPTPYLMPNPISLDAGFSGSGVNGVFATDSSQGNAPRAITNSGGGTGSSASSGGAASNGGGGAQVTVNVQAMDSQSFMDRSSDIAMAVRQAMLETTILNDVIRGV